VLLEVSDMISSSRMKFCMMAIYYKFNKLQPAGCNRVSPACSVLVCTICIVLSVMIFLLNDHNNRGYSRSRYELGNKCVIMTHVGCEIICCCCVIDRSQLQLNH
jgi:hypothetical protein